jgi:hypothetical protein
MHSGFGMHYRCCSAPPPVRKNRRSGLPLPRRGGMAGHPTRTPARVQARPHAPLSHSRKVSLSRRASLAKDRTCACGSLAAGHVRGLPAPMAARKGKRAGSGKCRAVLSRREQDAACRRRNQEIRAMLDAALTTLGKGAS